MNRTIGLLAALAMCGCGADLISVESASLIYDAPAYGGLERHDVALVVLPGADERSACIRLECVDDLGETRGTELCVDPTERHELEVGIYARGHCVYASGILTHEDGEAEGFAVAVR